MADDDDQDIFDSLEREASEFTKVSVDEQRRLVWSLTCVCDHQDAEIDRIRKAFTLDA